MYKVNDLLVYKKDVCQVVEENTSSYILIPLCDTSLKITIPKDNSDIRAIISKEEVNNIIASIPSIKVIASEEKYLESKYRDLLNSGSFSDLITIIKTTYLRKKEKEDTKKKVNEKDKFYFTKAEEYLYEEFSIALNLSYDETKEYVIKEVEKLM